MKNAVTKAQSKFDKPTNKKAANTQSSQCSEKKKHVNVLLPEIEEAKSSEKCALRPYCYFD